MRQAACLAAMAKLPVKLHLLQITHQADNCNVLRPSCCCSEDSTRPWFCALMCFVLARLALDTLTLEPYFGHPPCAGGVKKEFFQLLTDQLLNEDFGMFRSDPDTRQLWFRCVPLAPC